MKVDRAKIGLAVLLTLLVFGVLALLFWDFIRDTIVIPLYYLLWIGDLILKSLPQGAYLVALVLISIGISVSTVRKLRRQPVNSNSIKPPVQTASQYGQWRNLYRNISTSQFARNQFQSEARRLVLAMIAYERGIDIAEAESLVRRGAIPVPEAIRQLVQKREIPVQMQPLSFLQRIGLLKAKLPHDPQLESLVTAFISFIEQHGETTHGGNRLQS
jgi:hypothetical protein